MEIPSPDFAVYIARGVFDTGAVLASATIIKIFLARVFPFVVSYSVHVCVFVLCVVSGISLIISVSGDEAYRYGLKFKELIVKYL